MTQTRLDVDHEKRADNDNRRRRVEETKKVEPVQTTEASFGQRWREARPSKTMLFWSCVAAIALTIYVGFTWGGWEQASTAQQTAETTARAAVVSRLATICVAQFNLDPAKNQKRQALQATPTYQQGEYVQQQGWATMPGDKKPDTSVADACAAQLMQ